GSVDLFGLRGFEGAVYGAFFTGGGIDDCEAELTVGGIELVFQGCVVGCRLAIEAEDDIAGDEAGFLGDAFGGGGDDAEAALIAVVGREGVDAELWPGVDGEARGGLRGLVVGRGVIVLVIGGIVVGLLSRVVGGGVAGIGVVDVGIATGV